jgi:diaminopimelate decarboxylase
LLTTTGVLDSKFGFSIETGAAEQAIVKAMASESLELMGVHFHLGSPLFELEPYTQAIGYTLQFCATMRDSHNFQLLEFSPGGGFAVNCKIVACESH